MADIFDDSSMENEKIRDLEKRIQELEYEKLLRPLELRVQSIEKILYVVAAVALIFGAGGSWGLVTLRASNKQLADLQGGAKTVQDARTAAVTAVIEAKNSQLASLREQAHQMVGKELDDQQIGLLKKDVVYIYERAHEETSSPDWQKRTGEKWEKMRRELKMLEPVAW